MASWMSTAATAESTPPDKPADHPAGADLRADALDGLVAERLHGPVAAAAGDVAHEVADELRALRRVHDLGVELDRVELALLVRHDRERRIGRDRQRLEALAAAGSPGRHGSSRPDICGRPARRPGRSGSRSALPLRRGRIPNGGRLRPRRRAATPSSAGRSRCRRPARPPRRVPAVRGAMSRSVTNSGPPERITPLGFISRKASSAFWNGTTSE